jgi:hypothetical protein
VASLYLFGSVARNEAGPGSDVDLFVDIEPGRTFSLIDLVGLKQLLQATPGRASAHRGGRDHPQQPQPAPARRHRDGGGARVLMARKIAPVLADILDATEIISEATRHVPDGLLATCPEIPWRKIRCVGRVLRHEDDTFPRI